MNARLLLAALPAAALIAASGLLSVTPGRADAWPPLASAGPFLYAQLENMAHSRYARAWALLYPPHRRLVTRGEYVACERAHPLVAPLRSARTVRVRRAPVRVAGAARPLAGVEVTERIALGRRGGRGLVFTHTFHLVPVDGHWTWLLSAPRYRLYRGAGCRVGPSL